MNEELKQLGQDLVEAFKKYGIEISEGSLVLKTKPCYRSGCNFIMQPIEITLTVFYPIPKKRIDGTYDDIYM